MSIPGEEGLQMLVSERPTLGSFFLSPFFPGDTSSQQ